MAIEANLMSKNGFGESEEGPKTSNRRIAGQTPYAPDGSWEIIGAAPVTIHGNPPPPPPPPPGGGGCESQPPDMPQLPCDQPNQY